MFRVLRRLSDQRIAGSPTLDRWAALRWSDQTDSQPNDASFDLSFPALIFLLHALTAKYPANIGPEISMFFITMLIRNILCAIEGLI